MDSESDGYETASSGGKNTSKDDPTMMEYLREQREQYENRRQSKKNQQVLFFSDSDNDDDEEEGDQDADADENVEIVDSDIEGADNNDDDDDDDPANTMDWGTDKRAYYNTDFVDRDTGSYNVQEEDMAKAEQEEAEKIQLRLAKQLNEADFELDAMGMSTADPSPIQEAASKKKKKMGIKVTTDLAGLSQRERVQLLQKDSPEFMGLVKGFQRNLSEVQQLTAPVLNYVRRHQMPMVPALQFAALYQKILLTYCSNVTFYMLLKAKRSSIKYHPVIKRLVQLNQLRDQLAARYEEYIKPQLEALLERINDGDSFTVLDVAQRRAKLQILDQYDEEPGAATIDGNDDNDDGSDADVDAGADDDDDGVGEQLKESEDAARRGITYQMAKNKGLTPHRKKELRNPRVKHRGKYRKALIRRKGAVRAVRTEVKRYGGEISGIKATVTKSVKFKT